MPKELKGIGQPKAGDTLWRYMSFEKFANILATESLFLQEPISTMTSLKDTYLNQ